jgi:Calcineurin-like phosphoesterase
MRYLTSLSLALLSALSPFAARADDVSLQAGWVQMAPGGEAEARAVVRGSVCPALAIDGTSSPMRQRAAVDKDFPVLLCSATLPRGAKSASVQGLVLMLPKPAPERIIILGDTGCRIKGSTVQACNDPTKWPFPVVAASAARLKPDLVIHVGDYLYRESSCPGTDSGCTGSPSGDNWPTWAADFFTPAKPLLASAPWVVVRGNHEECARSGAGWLRLLGPLPYDPSAPCNEHVAPYAVPLGGMTLAVMDDAHASDIEAPDGLVTMYRADFTALARLAPAPVWLVMHRPIWGVVKFPMGMVLGGNRTLMAALDDNGVPPNIALLIAGHIHTFEAINYEKGAPPQLLAGEGGDLLDSAPADFSGQTIGTMKVTTGMSLPGYGFLLLAHSGNRWTVDVRAADGAHERYCSFAAEHLDCAKN